MVNENVIKEMLEGSEALVENVKKEFGNQLVFEITAKDYDRPRTAYIVTFNAFGFMLDVVYEFETEEVIVYDYENGRDVMCCDIEQEQEVCELFDGIYYYALWLHHSDSTNGYTIL